MPRETSRSRTFRQPRSPIAREERSAAAEKPLLIAVFRDYRGKLRSATRSLYYWRVGPADRYPQLREKRCRPQARLHQREPMPFVPRAPLHVLIDVQCGVISRQQAIESGMAAKAIDNKLRSGRWRSLQRGVYATLTGTPPREAQLWAVAMRAGLNGVLSHQTAAELYGIGQAGRLVHVTVPVGQNGGRIAGAVVHCSRHVDESRHRAYFPPRTRVEDTVLDLAQAAANLDEAFDWLCRAIGRRITTTERVREALERRGRIRWRGDLGTALDDVDEGARSVLERRYITGVERPHGLPPARRQARTVIDGQTRYRQPLRGGQPRGGTRWQRLASARAAPGRQPARQRARGPANPARPLQLGGRYPTGLLGRGAGDTAGPRRARRVAQMRTAVHGAR